MTKASSVTLRNKRNSTIQNVKTSTKIRGNNSVPPNRNYQQHTRRDSGVIESFYSATSMSSSEEEDDDNSGVLTGIMAEFREDYNDPVKLEFFKRIPDYLRIFLI